MPKNQSNFIKLIAIISMALDHIGLILFPEYHIFRIIGRIAFPLFAFQIGIGYLYTRNYMKYLTRIFLYGLVIQVAFGIATNFVGLNEDIWYLNIFFTLGLGLMAINFYDHKQYAYLFLTLLVPPILQSFGVTVDYMWYGVVLILVLFIGRNKPIYTVPFVAVISFVFSKFDLHSFTQMYCLLSFIFLIKPLNLKINIPGYVFYLFYPIHLVVLQGLSLII
jgi:hypothetical protein